jgi:hypothetical protein
VDPNQRRARKKSCCCNALPTLTSESAAENRLQLGKFWRAEDIAEALLLLFRPTMNRQWATLQRNASASLVVSNASGEHVLEIADYVKAGTAIAQTLPDLLEETVEGAVPEESTNGVLRQRLQFTPCSAQIDSVTMDLPVGMPQHLIDSISPECAPRLPRVPS